ncbi:MAG TPA: hypothetical protein VG370_16175 [Chloroflexota bacterium]|nr:hypothetical protein [Chloroflexota bacterium]
MAIQPTRPPAGRPNPLAHEAPQGLAARYLAALRPILVSATNARANWVRFLNELAMRSDLARAAPEAVQVALGQSNQFAQARRQLTQLQAPPSYQDMHAAIEGWLKSLELSCQIVVRQTGPLTPETLTRVREALHEAAADADRFNAERAAVQAVVKETARPSDKRPRMIANRREIRIVAIVLGVLLALLAAGVWASGVLSTGPEPTPTLSPADATATAVAFLATGGERRVYTLTDIQKRLDQEIAGRRVAYREATIRLVPPDRAVVSGRIQGTANLVSVEVELQVLAENGKPKIVPQGLRALGVEVPREAFDALNKRAEEGNEELAKQLQPGEVVQRVVVEPDQVIAEIVNMNNIPTPGTPTPANP